MSKVLDDSKSKFKFTENPYLVELPKQKHIFTDGITEKLHSFFQERDFTLRSRTS